MAPCTSVSYVLVMLCAAGRVWPHLVARAAAAGGERPAVLNLVLVDGQVGPAWGVGAAKGRRVGRRRAWGARGPVSGGGTARGVVPCGSYLARAAAAAVGALGQLSSHCPCGHPILFRPKRGTVLQGRCSRQFALCDTLGRAAVRRGFRTCHTARTCGQQKPQLRCCLTR